MKGFNKKGNLKLIGFLLTMAILSMSMIGCGLVTSSSTENSQIESLDIQNIDSTTPETAIEDPKTPEVKGTKLTMDLYFPGKGSETVLAEKHELTVFDGAVLRAAVEGLLAGPDSKSLISPIPEGTKLLGINLKNDLAIIDFSKEFKSAKEINENVEKISLVNTLTEFSGVNKVKILVEGYDWTAPSGEPYGEMMKIPLDEQGTPIEG